MRAGAVSRAAVGPGLGLWAKQYLVSPSSSALVAATNRITGTRRPVGVSDCDIDIHNISGEDSTEFSLLKASSVLSYFRIIRHLRTVSSCEIEIHVNKDLH